MAVSLKLSDRVLGGVIGSAVGDALGALVASARGVGADPPPPEPHAQRRLNDNSRSGARRFIGAFLNHGKQRIEYIDPAEALQIVLSTKIRKQSANWRLL